MFKQIKFDKNRDIQSQTVDENDSCDEDDEDDIKTMANVELEIKEITKESALDE